jgi:cytochrome P450
VKLLERFFARGAAKIEASLAETIDLEDPAVSADPYPWYERLRAEGDVVYLLRHDFWIVLSDGAAREVFAHPELFSSSPYTFVDTAMLSVDPPLHGPVRRLVGRYFNGEVLRRLEAQSAELAAVLLEDEIEIVGGFARPLSRQVAASLIGFDQEAVDHIARAEDAAAASQDPFPLILAAIDAVAPDARLIASLLEDGDGLVSEDDARSLVRLLWLASTATTERTISQCVLRLVEAPALHDRLHEQPDLTSAFVEEVLRLTPPENLIQRRAVAASQLGGATIPAGAAVQICLPAANRDPARYEAPGELRLDRGNSGALSFGSGIHQCVGGPMTRRVVNAAMRAFIERSVHPLRLQSEVKWVNAMVVCAPREMWVTRAR